MQCVYWVLMYGTGNYKDVNKQETSHSESNEHQNKQLRKATCLIIGISKATGYKDQRIIVEPPQLKNCCLSTPNW